MLVACAVTDSGAYELNGDELSITDISGETTTSTVDLNENTLSGNIEYGDFGTVEIVFQKS